MSSSHQERTEFRRQLRTALTALSPENEVRRLIDDPIGVDPAVWRRLSGELGLPGLIVPEELGGQGLGLAELAIAVGECARALLCAPVLSSSLAATVLTRFPDHIPPGLATGDVLATVAVEDSPQATAELTGNTWHITGSAAPVPDAQQADLFLISARTGTKNALFSIPAAPGLRITRLPALDLTRRQYRLDLAATPATLITDDATAILADLADLAALLASVELTEIAARCLELATEYARSRTQFGQPIGQFQAIKHLLADALADTEQMRAIVDTTIESGAPQNVVSVAKAFCSVAGPRVAETLIQVLGGIGFTWEHPAHVYLRRATSMAMLYGSARSHRMRLEGELGLTTVLGGR